MTHILCTPANSEGPISKLLARDGVCRVEVSDDKAFDGDQWLNLGDLKLVGGSSEESAALAAQRGAFEWKVPAATVVMASLKELLGFAALTEGLQLKAEIKLGGLLNSIACIPFRLGLLHPVFDPQSLQDMPFKKSATVVADTSGALQGGLDFVARFLHPAARVKVPAIVHMEIVNFGERFLANRRASRPRRIDLLGDHVRSQGGQRVLLRLELHSSTEVERTFLLGDPLRNAFQKEADQELSELNLSGVIGAYADRLILEAARNHQAQSSPGHAVYLLTSDQGLARMALAEGLKPLFFRSIMAEDFFGKTLFGSTFHPFTGRVRGTSVSSLLWELACAFGSVRLTSALGDASVRVSAIGDDMPWSPYQSQADLLWMECTFPDLPAPVEPAKLQTPEGVPATPLALPTTAKGDRQRKPSRKPLQANSETNQRSDSKKAASQPVYLFSVGKLFQLVTALDDQQALEPSDVKSVLSAKSPNGAEEYRRFLQSGGAISIEEGKWKALKPVSDLAIAVRNEDTQAIRQALRVFPSFSALEEALRALGTGRPLEYAGFKRAEATYRTLAEVTLLAANIADEGLYSTPTTPVTERFVEIALTAYREVAQGETFVATGRWLEHLIRQHGIHPEVARACLNDASARGLLKRFTEGSTTEVRFANHVVQVLRTVNGSPVVYGIHLYRGDYLIPGKSSTSLRIEGVE